MINGIKPNLSDITICAADCVTPTLAARALEHSIAQCTFGDAILFSDTSVSGAFRSVAIPKLTSREAYSRFVLQDLAQHIQTPFVLVAQWDGYVVDAAQWTPEFANYDYIGARWPWRKDGMTVGNGGFSLRSKKLLHACLTPGFQFQAHMPEDDLICRINRPYLEREHGIRFAPEEIAMRFSYEWEPPQQPTFGFHSLSNMWRHVSDADIVTVAAALPDSIVRSSTYMALASAYYAQRKYAPWAELYRLLKAIATPTDIAANMAKVVTKPELVPEFVRLWDRKLTEQ